MAAQGHRVRDLRRAGRPRHGRRHAPGRGYADEARPGRRARVPVRHRVGHGAVAGRPHRDAGRQLPQRHAAGVLRTVGQRHGAAPAAGRAELRAWRPAPRSAWRCRPSTRPSCARPASPAPRSSRRRPCCRHRPPAAHRRHRRHRRPPTPARPAPAGSASGRLAPNKGIEFAAHGAAGRPGPPRPGGDARGGRAPGGARLHGGAAPLRRRAGPARRRRFTRRAERRRAGRPPWRAPTCSWSRPSTRASGSR